MTTLRLVCALLVAFLTLVGGHAAQANELSLSLSIPSKTGQNATELNLTWHDQEASRGQNVTSLCTGAATLIYTTASHPGGNKRGLLNEHNGGRGGRCYLDRDKHFYFVVAALINSQYGDTLAFGPGVKWRLFEGAPQFGSPSLDVGAEIPYVHYAYGPVYGKYRRPQGKAINSPLPMLWAGVNVKFGNVEAGMMQLWLPKGAAQLRATVIEGSFAPVLPMDHPAAYFHDSQSSRSQSSGPAIFLRYSFTSLFGL